MFSARFVGRPDPEDGPICIGSTRRDKFGEAHGVLSFISLAAAEALHAELGEAIASARAAATSVGTPIVDRWRMAGVDAAHDLAAS